MSLTQRRRGTEEESAVVTGGVIGAAIEVHRTLGPGLLEAAHEEYALSKAVAEDAPERWIPELLDARERRLARRAVHLWRADFA